ncbi:MAG: hypothetical protein LBN36_04920 [Clostridiales Family XIII bacterium]|jgi:hypothetical protein|nr:hypothetical protein [Clostridiales Family XIII bacterium]
MKQFIVAAALLPILLALITQFMSLQLAHARVVRSEGLAYTTARTAEIRGAFTADLAEGLASEIARIYDLSPAEVSVRVDGTDGDAPGFHYSVTIPIRRIVASNRLFGISDLENSGHKTIEGTGIYVPKYEPPPGKPDDEDPDDRTPDTDPSGDSEQDDIIRETD